MGILVGLQNLFTKSTFAGSCCLFLLLRGNTVFVHVQLADFVLMLLAVITIQFVNYHKFLIKFCQVILI